MSERTSKFLTAMGYVICLAVAVGLIAIALRPTPRPAAARTAAFQGLDQPGEKAAPILEIEDQPEAVAPSQENQRAVLLSESYPHLYGERRWPTPQPPSMERPPEPDMPAFDPGGAFVPNSPTGPNAPGKSPCVCKPLKLPPPNPPASEGASAPPDNPLPQSPISPPPSPLIVQPTPPPSTLIVQPTPTPVNVPFPQSTPNPPAGAPPSKP